MSTSDDKRFPMRDRRQPERSAIATNPRLTVIKNALAESILADVRDARTSTTEFERLAVELASLVLWEACRDVTLSEQTVPGYGGTPVRVNRLAERIAGVVILRAGLLFAGPYRRLLRNAPLYQIGLRRDEATLEPRAYTDNLPESQDTFDRLLLLDPMLATGGSAAAALRRMRDIHSGQIVIVTLIAAPLGVETVLHADQACSVVTVALDDRLDARGYIDPGLGDAGDRLFGTNSP